MGLEFVSLGVRRDCRKSAEEVIEDIDDKENNNNDDNDDNDGNDGNDYDNNENKDVLRHGYAPTCVVAFI